MNRMTKLLLLVTVVLIAAGMFYGCGKRPEVIEGEFAELISVDGKVTPETMTSAAEYMDQYLHKLDKENASRMLIAYERYMSQYINTDADHTQVQSLLPYFDEKKGSIDKDKIKKDEVAVSYFRQLADAYISVGLKEGKIVLWADFAELGEAFSRDVLPAVAELYEIKTTISENPVTDNATLQISYGELLHRAAQVENLIQEYRDEELIAEDTKWMYASYLNMILIGTTNSPVFDYQTGVFSADAKAEYQAFSKKNPDTSLTWALNEYFRYLDDIGYTMDYKDSTMSKAFFDNCARIASETEKRVYQ